MRKKNPDPRTRREIIASARDLFLSQGVAATGIEQICLRSGVSKGALFHYFGSKEELVQAALSEWLSGMGRRFADAPFRASHDPLQQVFAYIDFISALARELPPGCLIGVVAQETAETAPALRKTCADALEQWAQDLAGMLRAAKTRYAPRAGFSPDELARHFVTIFEGAQLLARAHQDTAVVAEQLGLYRDYLTRLFAQRTEPAAGPARSAGKEKTSHESAGAWDGHPPAPSMAPVTSTPPANRRGLPCSGQRRRTQDA